MLMAGMMAMHLAASVGGDVDAGFRDRAAPGAEDRAGGRDCSSSRRGSPRPSIAAAVASAAAGRSRPRVRLPRGVRIGALVGPRIASWYRRATVAARILALFLAFLVPTLLLHLRWISSPSAPPAS